MTTPSSPKPKKESNFGSFAFGVAVGVGATLLLGTEEGRKFTQKILDTFQKNLPQNSNSPRSTSNGLPTNTESTPHSTTFTPPDLNL